MPVGNGAGKYSILNYGVSGLAGFEFGRVFLTANYSRGLNDFYEPADYTATNYKHEVIGASHWNFSRQSRLSPNQKTPIKMARLIRQINVPNLPGPVELLGCPDTDNDGVTR